jgi:two-component system, NarL family, nitrate/nitrite response regulator NarL
MRMASAELDWEVESSPAQSRQSTDAPAPPTDPQIAGRAVSLLPNKAAARSRSRSSRPRRAVPVVVVDKSALFRAGLVYILSGSRFRVAASCSALADLSERIFSDKRCIVLISLDEQTAPILSRVVSLAARGVRVIALSERFQPEEAFAAIEAGADGYLLKNEISPDALVKSLELVLLGGVIMPQGLSKLLHQARLDTPPVQDDLENLESVLEVAQTNPEGDTAGTNDVERLSNRERVILKHLMQGASNKQIARELNIAEQTVKVHVKSLLRKIRVNNRTQAAMWAMENRTI